MTQSHPGNTFFAQLQPHLERTGAPYTQIGALPEGGISWFIAQLAAERSAPVVLVTDRPSRAEALHRELMFLTSGEARPPSMLPFPAWEVLPFEGLSPFGPLVAERLATLFRLTQMSGLGPVLAGDESGHTRGIVITTPAALMQRVMPREVLAHHGFAIRVGDQLDLPQFRKFLAVSGYHPATQVAEPGEFAVRGGIVDFFPPGGEEPVRIELFGDEVETLRHFDPMTQRSTDAIPRIQALPMCEVILNEETIRTFRKNFRAAFGGNAAEDPIYKSISQGESFQGMEHFLSLFHDGLETVFDYLPEGSLFLLEANALEAGVRHGGEIAERAGHVGENETGNRHLPPDALYLSGDELSACLNRFSVLLQGPEKEVGDLAAGFLPLPTFREAATDEQSEVVARGVRYLDGLRNAGVRIGVAARTVGQRELLRDLLKDHKTHADDTPSWKEIAQASPGTLGLAVGDLAGGFYHPGQKIALIPEGAFLGNRVRSREMDRRQLDQLIASFADLKEGNLVVHADHGVGRYGGLHTLDVGALKNDFLLVSYAGEDKLYVPVETLDRVSKYTGGEGAVLDKLGGPRWKRTKQKARKKILEMADELVRLQAEREARKGFAFAGPDPLYQEFAAAFPFEETPDQSQAIQTVLEDMASPRPMDRLVCGDVGFGKTEVALRAAFRAVMDGKQVAILAPTTILAQQHYETFARRLVNYPVRVASLSRFRSTVELRKSITALAQGQVDVVIGTHRLLQKDVIFKDLGLLIVDEEQRFGVTHKEKIKTLRSTVDILTLTATPIPRTMHMAMAGVRDISIIATPPVDRLAIRTMVTHYRPERVREAILREVYRGGQVFYLYNQVRDIDAFASKLAKLVPEAKVGVAHGQMRENRLERVMLSFYRQEFNVLVCSTIIENGVDIPSANTILIHRADKFGLAQLHQLRGRVGRSGRRAYAYLLIPHRERLSRDAARRLEAIETLGDLGAGFLLATHDLEIRGAGNILGDEQSGQIKEVGFELYNQMLNQAIRALKGEISQKESDQEIPEEEEIVPTINLSLSTFIPEDYVPDVHQRLSLYKRMAGLKGLEEIRQMGAELVDRFSKPPQSVTNLLMVMRFKFFCRELKITKLEAGPKGGAIQFHPEPNIDPGVLFQLIQKGAGKHRFNQETRTLGLRERDWGEPEKRLAELEAVIKELKGKK
ncbi:MAG: transcription-repair coupling factor [Magnetococcales bacterium]|nr:transcription-repair coupling factor [Magnetococcales bacterium]